MNEKRIIEGKYYYISKMKKILIIASCISAISGLMLYIGWKLCSNYSKLSWDNLYVDAALKDKYNQLSILWGNIASIFLYILIPAIVVAIILLIAYLLIKNTELIVTDKRVYGRSLWGKRVDLPLDSISAVGTTIAIFKGIGISTSSGRILFLGVDNISDIHKEISKLLIDRQNNNSNNTPIQTSSNNNMDDIIKLKEMLDADIITQEEFDIKKKELLGL